MSKIPWIANSNWEEMLRRSGRRLQRSPGRSTIATEALSYPGEELGADLSNLMSVRGTEEAEKVIPAGKVRNRLRDITRGNAAQNIGGGIGAAGGGLLGGGIGAAVTRLAKGPGKAKWGLLAGIPAAVGGFGVGKGAVREQQVLQMLDNELGPGAGIKRAYVEEGFNEILDELSEQKKKGTFNNKELKDALRDLKEGRGHGLKPSERHLIRRHLYGQKTSLPQDTGSHLPSTRKPELKPFTPKPHTSTRVPKPKPPKHWIGRKPLVIAGGLAALAGLGLTAAKLWPGKEEHNWLTKK